MTHRDPHDPHTPRAPRTPRPHRRRSPSRVFTSLALAGSLAFGLGLGCSLLDWTLSATDSDATTDATDSTATTDGSSTGNDPAVCGDPPAAPPCAQSPSTSPLTTLCRARTTQAACLADAGGGSANSCAWAMIETYGANDDSCSLTGEHGECIGIQANAGSCTNSACDGAVSATAYYRFNDQCQVETFTASLCGWQVLDWNECAWDGSSPDACTQPWPSAGPASCRCHC